MNYSDLPLIHREIFYLHDYTLFKNYDLENMIYEQRTKKRTTVDVFDDKVFLDYLNDFLKSKKIIRAYLYFKYHCKFDKTMFRLSYSENELEAPLLISSNEFLNNFDYYFDFVLSGKDIIIDGKTQIINFLLLEEE